MQIIFVPSDRPAELLPPVFSLYVAFLFPTLWILLLDRSLFFTRIYPRKYDEPEQS